MRVLSAGRLLDFLDQCVVVVRLIDERLLLLFNYDTKCGLDLLDGDYLVFTGLRALNLFNLAVQHFNEVVVTGEFFFD